MQTFIGLLTALLGSAGFALIFNVRKQLLPLAALGGADVGGWRMEDNGDGLAIRWIGG